MDEIRSIRRRRMDAGDNEGRRGHASAHPHGGAHALGQRGLAGSQAAGEHDEVPRPQQGRQTGTQGPGRIGIGGVDHRLSVPLMQGPTGHGSS